MVDKINGTSVALQGLLRAESRVAESAVKVASGDLNVEDFVEFTVNVLDVQTQGKNLQQMLEKDKKLLDILA